MFVVLSIGKLGAGQEEYYLGTVARGQEEYYTHSGEAPGTWLGGGSTALGLSGRVIDGALRAVLAAVDPDTGERLGGTPRAKGVRGFDLTFSAPKSVSLLHAVCDPDVADQVRVAHDAAVADALGYLERTAAWARRGRDGVDRIPSGGFVGAAFRHRTSRAGDPHLHTHVVVANRVRGEDGRWSAIDGRALYVQARTAGFLYQASLRHHLRGLGLDWTVGRNGLGEITDVPVAVLREFSQRRQQVEAALAARGSTSMTAGRVAVLATRAPKAPGVRVESLVEQWRQRAAEHGLTTEALDALLADGADRVRRRHPSEATAQARALVERLVSPEGLTANASTFGEREVLRTLATGLPDGAPVAEVERLAREVVDRPEVVRLDKPDIVVRREDVITSGGRRVPTGVREGRYSTAELIAVEERLLDAAMLGVGVGAATAAPDRVALALARRSYLSDEQQLMVRSLCTSGDAVQVVHALAGAGKTTALDAAVQAWQDSGVPVVGACLSARAAAVLGEETGLPASTIARLLADLDNPASGGLPPGCVLVVDEAGQVGTRTLATLAVHTRAAGGKLVLVGDTRQLPEIDAGGAFRALVNRLDPVELSVNRRQKEPAERDRLAELRDGDVVAALTAYEEAGRIHIAPTADEVRGRLVGDWAAAYLESKADPDGVLMLALTNGEVDDLNMRARRHLAAAGRLTGDEVVLGGRAYAVGDTVVTRINDRNRGVMNGDRWSVVATGPDGLDVRHRDGRTALLDPAYAALADNAVHHGYAVTVNLAQGSTTARTFVVASDAFYREAGYVAASRARGETDWYLVTPDGPEPAVSFEIALGRERAEVAAVEYLTFSS